MLKIKHLIIFSISIGLGKTNFRTGKATTLRLDDGNEIPVLGLGTSARGGSLKEIQNAVEIAIDAGYRHIDTAAYYNTEKQVGLAVKAKIGDGTVKRENLFITTKLANDRHRQEQVVPALRESLGRLALHYVDLYLVHTPISQDEYGNFTQIDFAESWKGMEEAQSLGLTRSIGVSNFNETQIQKLLDSSNSKPVVNQVEVNPNLTQKKLVSFCQGKGIQVVAYAPLGSIALNRFNNGSQGASRPPHLDDPVLMRIGEKYKKTTVQIVLRYLIDRGVIPIPKSVTPSRIKQNIELFDFKLTPEEVGIIDNFNQDYRIFDLEPWKESIYFPY